MDYGTMKAEWIRDLLPLTMTRVEVMLLSLAKIMRR